jgi:predicted PurR-regulated permease PerM
MKSINSISGNLITVTLFLIIVLSLTVFLAAISPVVKLLIISALLAYVLDPLASSLESRGMSRTAATAVVFAGIFVFGSAAYTLFFPFLSEQIRGLKGGFNLDETAQMVQRFENFLEGNFGFLGIGDLDLLGRIQQTSSHVGEWLIAHLLDAASLVTIIIFIPFIVFFLMKDGRNFKKAFVSIVPNRYFELSLYLLHKLDVQFGNYLRGQLLDATFVGTFAVCALWILGVKYYFLIGVFAGLANIVPYFGPITGAMIAIVVSILQTGGMQMALSIALAFVIIKLIDDIFVLPVVVGKSVHLHPLMVLLAILVGGQVFGILGMLLAIPLTSFVKVIILESIRNYRIYKIASP